jgi:hypothetical protein
VATPSTAAQAGAPQAGAPQAPAPQAPATPPTTAASTATPPAATPPGETSAAAATVATPAAATPATPAVRETWIIAGAHGVHEIDRDGKTVRTLASLAASAPRWLPGHEAVLYLGESDGRMRALHRLDLRDGSDRVLATLDDAPPCKPEHDEAGDEELPQLSLTSADEFFVTADGKTACVELADYEAEMRSNWVSLAVDIADGRMQRQVMMGAQDCGGELGERLPVCAGPGRSFTMESPSPIADRDQALASPDGSWTLVLVASVLGDVVHQNFVLVDGESGKRYPLPRGRSRAWPKPITMDFGKREFESMLPALDDVGGGEPIVWIGPQRGQGPPVQLVGRDGRLLEEHRHRRRGGPGGAGVLGSHLAQHADHLHPHFVGRGEPVVG